MSSRLFKHQMAMSNRPPILPHLVTSMGEVYGFNNKTDTFTKLNAINSGGIMEFSPDGRYLVTSGGVFKRTPNGYIQQALPVTVNTWFDAAWGADSKTLYIANHGVLRLRLEADGSFSNLGFPWVGNYIRRVAVSPDGKYIACGNGEYEFLRLYKNVDQVITAMPATWRDRELQSLVWVGHDLMVIDASSYGASRYTVDPATNTITRSDDTGIDFFYSAAVAVSPDGQYLVNCNLFGAHYYKLNPATKKYVRLISLESYNSGRGASFSTDGKYLAMAFTGGKQLYVFRCVGDTLVEVTIPQAQVPTAGSLVDIDFAAPVAL